ncbi:MAG: glycosyltransferase family 2 protein, partial [Acidobacteriota bacterium]|nr:glycosyltransferase family 2 protein [Acidobacteriota bacterium]
MTEEPPEGDQADGVAGRAQEVLRHLAPGTPLRVLLAAVADTAGRAAHTATAAPGGPFLSVLVRTQGRRQATLQETLLSLAAQDSEDFEVLLLAHDVAPDRREVLEVLVAEFHPSFSRRVRVVPVDGGGRSRPLNAGAAVAAGRYLAVLDDDDLAFAGWVSGFEAAAGRAPGHVVRTSVAVQVATARPGAWDGQDGYEVTTALALDYPPRFDFLDHVDDNRTPINGYAVPRALVTALGQGWDESLPVLEDWDLLLRAASLCGVEDTATVGALLRSWMDSASSKTEHDPA